jgi:hypothetical protein
MPQYMTNVLAALKNNTIHCSICSDSVLYLIGGLAKKYSYVCLCARYDSEDCFIDDCIEVVCCSYIFRVLEHDENQLQLTKESSLIFLIAARKKRKKRLCNKKYLGNSSFANELHCSFHELITILSNRLGYLPSRVHLMEE